MLTACKYLVGSQHSIRNKAAMAEANLQTALYSTHQALGARMVPFGGWDMPVQYSGILAEVKAVRTATGVFDVSHMGRLYISGPQATEFLDWVLTGSVISLRVGRARYCLICNEAGGVIDDTIFYRLAEDSYLLIPNAGNRRAVIDWFQHWIHANYSDGCTVEDRTETTALLAFQGPGTPDILDQICTLDSGDPPSSLRPFGWGEGTMEGKRVFAARTGYTGEDGFEMVLDAADAEFAWQILGNQAAVPCGLGARDVLRLEASLPLHGHEIDGETTPIEAGLERFIQFDKEFVGAPVLRQQQTEGVDRRLVGLKMPGRSAPRQDYPILDQGQEVGRITSGSYSPTLDTSIAMGYVLLRCATPGTIVDVDIRGRISEAEVVPFPFYRKPARHST